MNSTKNSLAGATISCGAEMEISSHVLHVILVVTEYLMCVSFLREPTPSDTSTGNHLLTKSLLGVTHHLLLTTKPSFFTFSCSVILGDKLNTMHAVGKQKMHCLLCFPIA